MTNRFYNESFSAPFGSQAKSLPLDAQFGLIAQGIQLIQEELDRLAGISGITSLQGFPASFSGQAGKVPVVNSAESGLEFRSSGALKFKSVAGTSYELLDTDPGHLIAFSNDDAITVTVPPNASVPIDVGGAVILTQYAAGQITPVAGAGVTLRAAGGLLKTRAQFSQITLIKVDTNEWLIGGDVA
jgi:hypothetical protein